MSIFLATSTRAAWLGRHHWTPTTASPRLASLVALQMSNSSSPHNNKKTKTVHGLLHGKRLLPVEDCVRVHGEPGVQFVDGSWFLKDRNGRLEFEQGPRIPGAHYFDIDDVASKNELNPKGLPHMMPPAKLFASAMDAMGIANDDHLIVYSTRGCMMVHRALFQLQAHGHDRDRVHLMDGSLADWEKAGGPLDKEPTQVPKVEEFESKEPTQYVAKEPTQVVDIDEVKRIIAERTGDIIVDVRSSERFYGQVEEPRAGLRKGHMPGAKNLFFVDLLQPDNVSRFKPKEELEKLIKDAGIDIHTDERIVVSCGSGASACVLAAALDVCGRDPSKTFIYDGSWSEWGAEKDTPITTDKEEE